jgi:nucleoside-diphosphate-sugar epimerase
MKIAVVGANGQVGRELCIILRHWRHDVTPIVRNPWGAAFLRHCGFRVHFASASSIADMKAATADSHLVIISAYADSSDGTTTAAMKTNRDLVTAVVAAAPPSSVVVFFSTVRVIADSVDPAVRWWEPRPPYDRVKAAAEREFLKQCRKFGRKGVALRLGHVIGYNQAKNDRFMAADQMTDPLLSVDGDAVSNTVHTATIAEACVACTSTAVAGGCYNLVNKPQWTWREVFHYLSPQSHEWRFRKARLDGRPRARWSGLIPALWRAVRRTLPAAKDWLPASTRLRLQAAIKATSAGAEIAKLQRERLFWVYEFDYKPMPPPFFPALTDTAALLPELATASEVFTAVEVPVFRKETSAAP